ncbi:dienelactone hydrolase family protein [Mycobacterium sp. 663a-19]|uniref:dienelactone hydrolase family protein n=1 Tax=Mycobacterium sp. 663a-19 TaxID=2986148 RepID=UPI002D1F0231|nr:dienelactone hydrolase family protein [Mycobacterium sp. 663a-19]MEB3980084.1 dienelactone hydrolase family protein [Mycobacterium sp. 663a-19]
MTAAAGELTADWLTLTTADGPMRLYRARPRDDEAVKPSAAVVVLQEAFGVNDHIQDVTRRLAAEGYLAVAPDLFHRSGTETVDYTDRDTAMRLIGELGAAPLITDIDAVLTHLADVEGIAADRTAVIGFCFGGRAAFTAATKLPVAATVVFYGPGIASGPHALLDHTGGISGPVLMFAGDADPTIPPEDLAAIQAAAQRYAVDLRLVVFTGAGHAFHCDARPAQYVADAARKAWLNTTEFLAETLPAKP